MYSAARFLQPVRISLSVSIAIPQSRLALYSVIPRYGKLEHSSTWTRLKSLGPRANYYSTKPNWNLFSVRSYCQYFRSVRNKGYVYNMATVVALCSAFGSISIWPSIAYSMDGFDTSKDDDQSGVLGGLYSEENLLAVMNVIRKLLIPVLLIVTVWMNWGNPVNVAVKIILILLGTKPIPSSVHIFVEQLRHQLVRQHPLFYRFVPLHAKMVEVEDYTLLCLARVEIRNERLVLIGILGSWWIMPLSSAKEVFLFDTSSWKELFSLVKNRFSKDKIYSSEKVTSSALPNTQLICGRESEGFAVCLITIIILAFCLVVNKSSLVVGTVRTGPTQTDPYSCSN